MVELAKTKTLQTLNDENIRMALSDLSDKSSPSTSDVNNAQKMLEEELTRNLTVAVEQYELEKALSAILKKNHNKLMDLAIKNKGQITEKDLAPYIKEATNQVNVKIETEAALKLFLGDNLSYTNSREGNPLDFLARLQKKEDRRYEGKSKKEIAAAKLENDSSDFYRFYIYESKIDDKPGMFARDKSQREFIDYIYHVASRYMGRSADYAAYYQEKAQTLAAQSLAKYQAIGQISQILENVVANTASRNTEKNSFQLNHAAYFEALSNDKVKTLVKEQPAAVGAAVFTEKMSNERSFAVNALRLVEGTTKEMILNQESFIVGGLLTNALGKEYSVELLKSAIEYFSKTGERTRNAEYTETAERLKDYIIIIENDQNFVVNDPNHANIKALINYNNLTRALSEAPKMSADALTKLYTSDEFASLVSPIKERILASRTTGQVNYLSQYIDAIKKAPKNSKTPALINEAYAIDQIAMATSAEFAAKLVADIIKVTNDPALKVSLESLEQPLKTYQPNSLEGYAKAKLGFTEVVKRNRPDAALQIVQQDFFIGLDTAQRKALLNTAINSEDKNSTPIAALYAYAKKGETNLAAVITAVNNFSANSKENNAYIETILNLGKDDEGFTRLAKSYLTVLAENDADTLKKLATTQQTLRANFNPNSIEAINEFLASPELNDLPENVQSRAINAEMTSQILIGLLAEAGEDTLKQAQAFARIGDLIKNADTVRNAYELVVSKVESKPEIAKTFSDYSNILLDDDSAAKIESFAKLRQDTYSALAAKDSAALTKILSSYNEEKYSAAITSLLFTQDNLIAATEIILGANEGDINKDISTLKLITKFDGSQTVFETLIENTEDKVTAKRVYDYAHILSDEESADHINAYGKTRAAFYAALSAQNADDLQSIIAAYTKAPYSDRITANLFDQDNLFAAANIMVGDNKNDFTKLSLALKTLNVFNLSDELYSQAVKDAQTDNEAYRLEQMVALINNGQLENLKQYAELDQEIQALLAEDDLAGLRDLLTSDKVSAENVSPDVVRAIMAQPLAKGESIPALILGYNADKSEEVAQNLAAVSAYVSSAERLEMLQKQNTKTGLNVFESMMADKDIYAQAETVITFSELLGDDNAARNTILQNYVNALRERNAENGIEEDTSEIKQFLTMVNIVAITLSDDELNTEQKQAQITKISGLLSAIKDLEANQDAGAFISFLKSDAYKNGIAEYSVYSPANLLKQYPSMDNNAMDILFAQTANDQEKELAFFANIEKIFAGDHTTMDFYEDLINKLEDQPEKQARIKSYVGAALDGQLTTLMSTKALTKEIEAVQQDPSLKKFKEILERDDFTTLDEANRAEILSTKIGTSENALPLAAEIITRSTKNGEKLAEAIKLIGAEFEQSATAAQVFGEMEAYLADDAALKAQYNEYVQLYLSNETEAMSGLAKVQTTIAKAIKDNDIATLAGLIEDESLRELGAARREQILSAPMIGDKTLLTLLTENANGDFDAEVKVFVSTAKAIDDPDLFDRLVSATIAGAKDDATAARYRSFVDLMNAGDIEDADAKISAVKAINSLIQNPEKITVETILAETNDFDGLSYDESYNLLNKATIGEQKLIAAAMANAKTPTEQAAAIQALVNFFEDDHDYARSLTNAYIESLSADSADTELLEERFGAMYNAAAYEDGEKHLANLGKVFTDLDKAKAKNSQIALSNVLTSSAFKALPSEIQGRFTKKNGDENIFKTMLSLAENNPVQEAEIVANILGASKNQGDAFERISEIMSYSNNDAQIERLGAYQKDLYASYIRINGGPTIDPIQVSAIEPIDRWYSKVIGKDGQTFKLHDDSDITKIEEAAGLVEVSSGTYWAKDEIGYVNYNAKKNELEFFHAAHTEDKPKLALYKCGASDAMDEISTLTASGQFVELPVNGRLSALNIKRIEAVIYDSNKNTLSIEMRTGNTLLKKVSSSDARTMLRTLLDSDEYVACDSRHVFIRKDSARAMSFNPAKNTIAIKGDHRDFELKNVSDDSIAELLSVAQATGLFIKDDKTTLVAKAKLALIGYDNGGLLLALSEKEKYTASVSSETKAKNIIAEFVATNDFIWRDEYSANSVARVSTIEIDTAMNAYTLTLKSGATLPAEGVSRSDLNIFAELLEGNPHIVKTGTGKYEVVMQTKTAALEVEKESLTTQFNATAVIDKLTAKVGVERVQDAINASAAWLNTMHAKEMDDESNKRIQALGALLVNAYSLHTDIPESIMAAPVVNDNAKPRVRAGNKSALSMLQESFNNASNNGAEATSTAKVTKVANDLGRKNPVMQYYQQALDKLAVK